MKSLVLFFLAALLMVATADNIEEIMKVDYKELLSDDVRRKAVLDCLLDQAPCGEYQLYKDTLPGIMESQCDKCSPEQKIKFEEVNKYILENYPEEYSALALKYAPKQDKTEPEKTE